MRTEFIYSVAALASFPIVVNAQVNAEDTGKIKITKSKDSWTKTSIELAPGKYSFLGGTNAFGKDAVLTITGTGIKTGINLTLKADDQIAADFEITAKSTVTITVKAAAAMTKDTSVSESSKIQLNFAFTKVAELLQIEYNKVTNALAAAEYTEKAQDAQEYSKLYDRIVAIAGADYAFYKDGKEGLQTIYADQTNVTDLDSCIDKYISSNGIFSTRNNVGEMLQKGLSIQEVQSKTDITMHNEYLCSNGLIQAFYTNDLKMMNKAYLELAEKYHIPVLNLKGKGIVRS